MAMLVESSSPRLSPLGLIRLEGCSTDHVAVMTKYFDVLTTEKSIMVVYFTNQII